MKRVLLILGSAFFLIAIFSLLTPHTHLIANVQSDEELALTERPVWAQWRAEGQGIVKYFLHFWDYQKKSAAMVLNPFPGQKAFFSNQKQG